MGRDEPGSVVLVNDTGQEAVARRFSHHWARRPGHHCLYCSALTNRRNKVGLRFIEMPGRAVHHCSAADVCHPPAIGGTDGMDPGDTTAQPDPKGSQAREQTSKRTSRRVLARVVVGK
jgi:hypothetical protein